MQILFFWFSVKIRHLFIFITNLFSWKSVSITDKVTCGHFSEKTLWLNKRKKTVVEKWHKLFGQNFVSNCRRVARTWHNMSNTVSIFYSKSFKNLQNHLSVIDPKAMIFLYIESLFFIKPMIFEVPSLFQSTLSWNFSYNQPLF